jgi:hypothetical protein
MSAENSSTHTHLCARCNQQFECDGDECEQFHFSTCPNCKPNLDSDAPAATARATGG